MRYVYTQTCIGPMYLLSSHATTMVCVFGCACALGSTEWIGMCSTLWPGRRKKGVLKSVFNILLLPHCFSHINTLGNCDDFFFYKPEPFSNLNFL